jgi:hypothetical protein
MTKNEITKKLENHIAVLYEGQYGYQPQTNISIIEGFIENGCHVTFIHKKDEKVLVSFIHDNAVKIEYKATNLLPWQECNQGKFIDSYDESFDWRLKNK